MFVIQASSEYIKSLAAAMSDCAELMNDILDHTSAAAELLEIGTKNGSIENMSGKMSALKKKEKKLNSYLESYPKLLMRIAYEMEKLENKLKNQVPDWAKETKPGLPNWYLAKNRTWGSVEQYNKREGKITGLSCTWYTLRRLREKGLGFPFKINGQANGGEWFKTASDEDAKKYPGTDCLDKLFMDYGIAGTVINNIVVSMGANPGHVLLIDKMYFDSETKK